MRSRSQGTDYGKHEILLKLSECRETTVWDSADDVLKQLSRNLGFRKLLTYKVSSIQQTDRMIIESQIDLSFVVSSHRCFMEI